MYESPLVIQILAALWWLYHPPLKQTDSIPATAFCNSLRSGSVYPCAVAALVEKKPLPTNVGAEREKSQSQLCPIRQQLGGLPPVSVSHPKLFFFFSLVPFVAKTFLPPAPFKNPSPTLFSFLFLSLSRLFHLNPLPTPLSHFPDTP